MLRMEPDLRTSAARLRAGLNNLSADPPNPAVRPLPRVRIGQPQPLGDLLREPRPEPSRPPRRPYVLRRKLPAPPDRPHHYAKLPRRAWQDPRLHRGAVASLAAILCAAAGRPCFSTLTRSLATAARVCERTMHNHLKLLAAAGYLVLHRVGRRGPLLVTLTGLALVRHRPLPPEVEAVWEARRSGHPRVRDALAAANRRLRRTLAAVGGPIGIAMPTLRIRADPESPGAGGRPGEQAFRGG